MLIICSCSCCSNNKHFSKPLKSSSNKTVERYRRQSHVSPLGNFQFQNYSHKHACVLSPQALLSQVSDILESVHKIQVSSQRQHFFQAMSPFSRFSWKHSIHSRTKKKNYSNKISPGSLPCSSTETSRTSLPPIRNFLRKQKVKRKSTQDLRFQNTKIVFFAVFIQKYFQLFGLFETK